MIAHWIVFTALLLFKLWNDTRLKNKGLVVWHILSAGIDVLLYSTVILLLPFPELKQNIGQLLIMLSARWVLFDAIFSKMHWGTWDKHGLSSHIDVFLLWTAQYLGKWHFLVKLIPLSIGILLIYI